MQNTDISIAGQALALPLQHFSPTPSLWALRYQIYNFNLLIVLCFISRSTGRLRLQSHLAVSCTTTKKISSSSGASWWMRLLRPRLYLRIAFSRKSRPNTTTQHIFAALTPSVFLDNFIRHSLITGVTTYGWMTTAAAVFREETKRKIIMRSLLGGGSEASSVVLISHAHPLSNVNDKCDFSVVDNARVCCCCSSRPDLYDKSFRWVFLGVNELI